MTAPAGGGRELPPDLARRMDELIGRGDVDGYLELLRETDVLTCRDLPESCTHDGPHVPLVPACDGGCDPATYWRQEAADARAEVTALRRAATAVLGSRLAPGPCLDCRTGCPLIGGPCSTTPADHEPDALYPGGHDTAPLTTGQRLLAAALVGPWLACAAGWTAAVGVAEVVRWVRR